MTMRYNDFVATAGYRVELLSLPSVLVLDGSRLLVCSSLLAKDKLAGGDTGIFLKHAGIHLGAQQL